MQTFLQYENMSESVACLDTKRLGKQRVEALQVHNIITGALTKKGKPYKGFVNHPVVNIWRDHVDALALYTNLCILEWMARGYKNTMEYLPIGKGITLPNLFGNKEFHDSHRSNLLRKDEEHYGQFGWNVPTDMPYVWT